MPNEAIVSFNSGELSPLIDARSDIEKYASGCRICENMIPRVYGVAERRAGFKYISGMVSNSAVGRLIPFIYSNAIAYIIEMGNLTFRYYYDGAILSGVTTVTPYVTADLFEVQYAQSNDVMWLVHQDYAPRQLVRTDATTFTMSTITFNHGPFLERNDYANDDSVTMTPNVTAKDAVGTLTASAATFLAGHVGALFKLTQPRVNVSTSGSLSANGTIGAAIDVDGPFTFSTSGHWDATVTLQRNENSNGWETYRTWVSTITGGQGSLNAQYTGIEYEQNVQYRMVVSGYSGGTINGALTVNTSTQSGIVRISSITSTTVAAMTVVSKLASTNATLQWYEGAWSGVRGYPKTVAFWEDRCIYAGTSYQPQTLWFSESGRYDIIA